MKKILFILFLSLSLCLFLTSCTKDKKHHSSNQNNQDQEEVIDDIDTGGDEGSGGSSGGNDDDDESDDINLEICGKISTKPEEIAKSNFKVINGYSCPSENSPVAKLFIETSSTTTRCSGVLIDEETILTAGHCFKNLKENVQSILVAFGTKQFIGKSHVVNPDYNLQEGIDTAIIKLSSKVEEISPVPIISSIKVNVGKQVIFYGYGITETGEYSPSLKAAYLKVHAVSDSVVKTSFDETKTSACDGDSGGPLVMMTSTGYAGILAIDSYGNLATCTNGSIETFSLLSNKKNLDFIKGNSSVSTL